MITPAEAATIITKKMNELQPVTLAINEVLAKGKVSVADGQFALLTVLAAALAQDSIEEEASPEKELKALYFLLGILTRWMMAELREGSDES